MLKKGLYTLLANGCLDSRQVKDQLYNLITDSNFYFKECEILGNYTYISFIAYKDINNTNIDNIIKFLAETFKVTIEIE